MNIVEWFDIIIIGVILILGIKGIINGLIKEVFGLIGLVGGLVVSSRFADVAGQFINDKIYRIESASMLEFISFVALWIVFWMVCILIGKFLSKLIGASGLGFLDRFGGFLAGSGKIFLVLSAVLAVISNTNLNDKISPYFKDSKVYPILLTAGKWIANMDVNAIKDNMENIIKPKENSEIITTDAPVQNVVETIKDGIIKQEVAPVLEDMNKTAEKIIIQTSDINQTKGE